MLDMFTLDIPIFKLNYKSDIAYGYKKNLEKENLRELLMESSKGHCMYCYCKLEVDGKTFGQLEHSIERLNTTVENKKKSILSECTPNIAIACQKCNASFKSTGERNRLELEHIEKFEGDIEDLKACKNCISECEPYKLLKQKYLESDAGKIILQPSGVIGWDTKQLLQIQYDILNQCYIPNRDLEYSEAEIIFIEKHIERFNLNDNKYKTRELAKFIEDIAEYSVIPKTDRYYNLLVIIFNEKLNILDKGNAIKICKTINASLFLGNK